jgi:AcrR family transcriptional regulator
MANRTNHHAKETRQLILTSARQVFERFGYKKATLDDIANALGMGKTAIYYHFVNKEDIFKAVLDHEADALKNELIEAVTRSSDAKSKIRTYFIVRVNGIKKLGNLYNFEKRDILSGTNASELRAKYDQIEIEVIGNILSEGQKSGEFRIQNVELAAVAIVTLIKGLEIQIMHSPAETLNQRVDELLPILFDGICAVS